MPRLALASQIAVTTTNVVRLMFGWRSKTSSDHASPFRHGRSPAPGALRPGGFFFWFLFKLDQDGLDLMGWI